MAQGRRWPGLARIVPRHYTTLDTRTARELDDALGLFTNVDPAPAAAAVAEAFVSVIGEHADQLRERYRVDADTVNETVESIISSRGSLVSLYRMSRTEAVASDSLLDPPERFSAEEDRLRSTRAPLTGILFGELDEVVLTALWDAQLALPSSRIGLDAHNPRYEWMAVHPDLAWIYKCVLSREVARQNRLHPTTDQIAAQTADQEWGSQQIATALLGVESSGSARAHAQGGELGLPERIALLAVHIALPNHLGEIPVAKIIKLRRRHGAEFDAFGGPWTTFGRR